jgi:hypothetical protein
MLAKQSLKYTDKRYSLILVLSPLFHRPGTVRYKTEEEKGNLHAVKRKKNVIKDRFNTTWHRMPNKYGCGKNYKFYSEKMEIFVNFKEAELYSDMN